MRWFYEPRRTLQNLQVTTVVYRFPNKNTVWMTLFAGQPRRTSQVLCVIRGENSISEITPSLCGARLDPGIEKCWRYQTHTSSMSKESAFSVRSWASLGGTRVGGTFSGVEVRFFFSSSSFPIAWVPFSVP